MRNKTTVYFALMLAFLITAGTATAEIIRLKSGRVLVGKIENPDEQGFDFLRFDNQGLLPIKWNHLLTGDVRRLKQKFGLAESEEKEILVKASKITYQTEGGRREIVGILVGRTEDVIILRRRGVVSRVQKDRLVARQPIQEIEVPALDVYTVDEFYQSRLQEILGGTEDDPIKHEKLARVLSAAGVFDYAQKHFSKVLELDPEYRNKSSVKRYLSQLDAAIKNKGLMSLITKVEQAKSRRNYVKAMEIAEELDGKVSEMPGALVELWKVRKAKLIKQRRNYLTGKVARTVYAQVRRVAAAKALEKEFSPQLAREFAEKEMQKVVLENCAELMDITLEEVQDLWSKREEIRGCTSIQSASYCDGTFLLSEDEAHADTALAEKKASTQTSKTNKRQEMQKRIREFLRRQGNKRGGSKSKGQTQLQSPEDWWKSTGINSRMSWIMAFFAEYSGMMKVTRVQISPCKTCGGTGKIKIQDIRSGKDGYQKCPGCHGYQGVRRVRFF